MVEEDEENAGEGCQQRQWAFAGREHGCAGTLRAESRRVDEERERE
jgi:hypothetical protein